MKRLFSSLALASLCGLVAFSSSAHAQLSLDGTTHGVFAPPAAPFTTVTNGPVVSVFASGVPATPHETKTSITFTGSSFADVGDAESFSLGSIKIKNGRTLLGSTATVATMDLYLNLPAYSATPFKVTTLLFGLDNTDNQGGQNIPDLFYIGNTLPDSFKINDTLVVFNLGFTDPSYNTLPGHSIPEGKTGTVGLYAEVSFTPVPEPSTYAAFAALGLIGVAAHRRLRRTASAVPATA